MEVIVVDDTGMYRPLVDSGSGDGVRVHAVALAVDDVDDIVPTVIVAHLPMADLSFDDAIGLWEQRWPDVQVVAVTDRSTDAHLAALLDAGAAAAVPIPVELDLLSAHIRAAARRVKRR